MHSRLHRPRNWTNTAILTLFHLLPAFAIAYLAVFQALPWTLGLGVLWMTFTGIATPEANTACSLIGATGVGRPAGVLPVVRCGVGAELGAEVGSGPSAAPRELPQAQRSLQHPARVGAHRLGALRVGESDRHAPGR